MSPGLAGCQVRVVLLKRLGGRPARLRQRWPEPNLFPVLESSFCCVGFEMP